MEPTKRGMRPMFVWLLPALWAVCSLLQHRFPGDEYGFYAVSALPGMWISPLAFRIMSIDNVAPFIVLAGAPFMALVGLAMDWVRTRKGPWGVLWLVTGIAIFCLVFFSFPNADRAIRKNGSLMAYALLATTAGLYAASLLSLMFMSIWWIVRRLRLIHVPA